MQASALYIVVLPRQIQIFQLHSLYPLNKRLLFLLMSGHFSPLCHIACRSRRLLFLILLGLGGPSVPCLSLFSLMAWRNLQHFSRISNYDNNSSRNEEEGPSVTPDRRTRKTTLSRECGRGSCPPKRSATFRLIIIFLHGERLCKNLSIPVIRCHHGLLFE